MRPMNRLAVALALCVACSGGSDRTADPGSDALDDVAPDAVAVPDVPEAGDVPEASDGALASDSQEVNDSPSPVDAGDACGATGLPETMVASLQTTLADGIAKGGIPGAVLAVDLGCRGRWIGAAGLADIGAKTPLTADHVLRIASVTKTYTAALIHDLAERGSLALADPIETYVPGVPSGDAITLAMLLNHTSGLFDYVDDETLWAKHGDPAFAPTPAELVATAVAHPPHFAPGSGWHYSNTNYVLLGMVVQKVAGTTFAKALRATLLDPLGLASTWFEGEEDIPAGTPVSLGYVKPAEDAGDLEDATPRVNPAVAWAAGAIAARAADVAAWGRALFAGGLLEPATVAAMETCVPTGEENGEWGLGVMCLTTPIGLMYGHAGGIDGYSSILLYVPGKDAVVVVLANLERADLDPFMVGVSMALMSLP